ncbi:MAG: hypothetical protein IH591_01960 [Bacteroidales bacterium]|nr:hypothetical protein [Bacteroidales bacterium]
MSDIADSRTDPAGSQDKPNTRNPSRHHLKKMENGYYKVFSEDGKEVTGVNLPINICLMALRGELPAFVKVCPSEEDIELEPSLKVLRDRYLADCSDDFNNESNTIHS